MRELLSGFLSNESRFGRIMTRCGVVIGANVMFVIFSLPVLTVGAAWTALYHVMFKALRGDGVVNPFLEFWRGFRSNFRQATPAWLAALALAAFGVLDVRICLRAGGAVGALRYPIFAMGLGLLIVMIYLFPTMAAFENTLPNLLRSGLYFALRSPHKLLVLLFFNVFPLYLTYSDVQMQPLYAFLWASFGFGAIALLGATLLLPDFRPYLPVVDAFGDFVLDENGQRIRAMDVGSEGEVEREMTEEEVLEEMKRLEL